MTGEYDEGLHRVAAGWFETGREARIGIPEAIYAPGKSDYQLVELTSISLASASPTIVTRLDPARIDKLDLEEWEYRLFPDPSRWDGAVCLVAHAKEQRGATAEVGILAAGSSDLGVASEAEAVLWAMGVPTRVVLDCGVAAPARVNKAMSEVGGVRILIVVAGFEAALATVVGALVPTPIVAVPTSVGYGATRQGETALFAMLASCAAGISVVGIDNGFGAGCAALRIVRQGQS